MVINVCGIETWINLVENPLTDKSNLETLEKRNNTQANIISDLVHEKNKIKETLKKEYWKNTNNMKNQYKQNLINMRKENKELNKERNNIKQKYNKLLNLKNKKDPNSQLKRENETLKKLLNIKKNNTPVPEWLKKAVFERDNYQCQECGHKGSKNNPLTVDHRVPRFVGGPNSMENLKTLCEEHNLSKGPSIDENLLEAK